MQADAARVPSSPSPSLTHYFRFHGTGGELFVLILKNLFFTVCTLGIYAAWAKAARRQFIWNNTEISGQRLSFTGTGLELFKGYLKLLGLYLLVVAAPFAIES